MADEGREKIGLESVLKTEAFSKGLATYLAGISKMEARTDQVSRQLLSLQNADGSILKISSSLTTMGSAGEKSASGVAQMAGQVRGLAAELGLLYGLGQIVGMMGQLATESKTLAREQRDARNALVSLVGGTQEYKDAVAQVREATRGTISETEAARTAFGLLDNGIAKTAEEAAQYALAGKALNSALGQTASYEKFLMLLDEGSPMLLNNFNITQSMIDAQQKLVEANTNLTGSEARLQAVREVALQKGLALAGTISQETLAAQQADAAMADFKAQLGELVIAIDRATGATPMWIDALHQMEAGARAWQFVLNEAIPAIQEHDSAMAANAAQTVLTASSYDEIATAVNAAEKDVDAFKSALIDNTSTHEEYQAAVDKVAESNIFLAQELDMASEAYDSIKASIADAVVAQGAWNSSIAAMGLSSNGYISSLQAMGLTAANTAAQIREVAVAQGQLDLRAKKETMPEIGVSLSESRAKAAEMAQKRAAEEDRANAQIAKANERMAKQMAKSMDDAAQRMASTIESVLQPTLDEVWQPPEGSVARFDEAARQLATVATSGFGSEWLNKLSEQFGGADFFQPIIAAMQNGDEGALKQAATDILTNQVTNLWDVEVIKQKVRQQLQQQQLREQIIQQVQQELAAEGTLISPETIMGAATGTGQLAQGFSSTGQAAAALGTGVSTTDAAIQQFNETVGIASGQQIPAFVESAGSVVEAVDQIAQGVTASGEDIVQIMRVIVTDTAGVVREYKWHDLGKYIDQGTARGIQENEHLVIEKIKQMFKNAFTAAETEAGIRSPSKKAAEISEMVVAGFTGGLDRYGPEFQNKLKEMLDLRAAASDVGAQAGAAADFVEKYLDSLDIEGSKVDLTLKLLKDAFKANSSQILNATDRVEAFKQALAGVNFDFLTRGGGPNPFVGKGGGVLSVFLTEFDRAAEMMTEAAEEAQREFRAMLIKADRQLLDTGSKLSEHARSAADLADSRAEALVRLFNIGAEQSEFEGRTLSQIELQEELNQALADQLAIQDDLAQLQANEARLDFLRKQLDLIEMANEAGLGMDIFQGLALGADAATPDVVEAANRVIQALIGQVESDLDMHSPSREMMDRGFMAGSSLAMGMDKASGIITAAATDAMESLTGIYDRFATAASFPARVFTPGGNGFIPGGDKMVSLTFGDVYVNGERDLIELQRTIIRTVEERL